VKGIPVLLGDGDLGAGDLKKAKDAAQSPEAKSGESRSAAERRLDKPGKRRVLKDPLYGPLARGADTSASGKGERFLRRSREGGSQQKAVEEKKRWHFLGKKTLRK
jgi:hypothetical protein